MYKKVFPNVAGAVADLAATVTRTTQWIPCRGARAVMFHWRATNGNAPVVAPTPMEGSNLDPLVTGGTGNGTTPGSFGTMLPTTVHPLNVGGGVVHTVVGVGAFLNSRAVRMSITGHATLNITALECVSATVIYDGDTDLTGVGEVSV
jgi:hypothetical protein